MLTIGILASCQDDQATGPATLASRAALQEDRPFYYHFGEPVYVDVDTSGYVIQSPLADPTAAVAEALSGLPAAQLARFSELRDHWVVRLRGTTNRGARAAALARLRVNQQLAFASPLLRYPVDGSPVMLTGRVVVRFKPGTTRASIDDLARAMRMRVLREPAPDSGRFEYHFSYPKDSDPLEVAALLDRHPLAEWAGPDMIAGRRKHSEPYFSTQYYLRNSVVLNGVRVDNNVEPAWAVTVGIWAVRVIVLDDGIDGLHPDLWCGEPFIWSYDAYSNVWPDTPLFPHANDFHGTAVAGIINGCHNSAGIAGIAPGISIGIARISRDSLFATDAALGDAINAAWASMGADVLSNSWGGGAPNAPVTNAINNAATLGRSGRGSIIVFAAGNPSNRDLPTISQCGQAVCPVVYPATLANVIAVGAINRNGQLTNYTPEGPELDIVAPSSHLVGLCKPTPIGDVVTTDRFGSVGCNDGPNQDNNYRSSFGGTSAAAPQVAAAAALLLSVSPNLTRQQVTALLLNNADRAGSWATPTQFGQGKLNIGRAMNQLVPPPLSAYISGPSTITAKGTYTWTANPSGGTGAYTYQWSMYFNNTGQTEQLGTGQSQQRTIFAGTGTFEVRVTVVSGGQSTSPVLTVTECIGSSGCYDP